MEQKPRRVQRTRRERLPENTAYVGRPTRWGNPFRVMRLNNNRWAIFDDTGDQLSTSFTNQRDANSLAVEWFAKYARYKIGLDPTWLDSLRGKNLACWCPLDMPCHADMLLELANTPLPGEAD